MSANVSVYCLSLSIPSYYFIRDASRAQEPLLVLVANCYTAVLQNDVWNYGAPHTVENAGWPCSKRPMLRPARLMEELSSPSKRILFEHLR